MMYDPKPPSAPTGRLRQHPLVRDERIHAHRNGQAVAFVASLNAAGNTDEARQKHGLGLRRVAKQR